jgi:protein-disulfide isomerase
MVLVGLAAIYFFSSSHFLFNEKARINTTEEIPYYETGPLNAKVTIVEFSDFAGPACGASYPIVSKLQNDYKGKVNFVIKEFPLSFHQNAYIAAEAAVAAGTQGKFWEMADKLYSNQQRWIDSNNALDIFSTYANELGMDRNKFITNIQNKTYDNDIQADIAYGNKLGVDAIPTFYINNQRVVGGLPYNEFKKIIDDAFTGGSFNSGALTIHF